MFALAAADSETVSDPESAECTEAAGWTGSADTKPPLPVVAPGVRLHSPIHRPTLNSFPCASMDGVFWSLAARLPGGVDETSPLSREK